MGKPHFRAGVVIAVRRADGHLLAFERSDVPGQWQLPQGGLERGETPEQAAWRELREETGLGPNDVRIAEEYEGWTAYMWPESVRQGDRLGQAHRWFFFEPIRATIAPTPDGTEFTGWKWVTPGELIDLVVDFRRQPYRQVLGG